MTLIHIDIAIQDEQEAARILSLLDRGHIPHRVQKKPVLSENEQVAAQERLKRGAPTLNINEMLEWMKESKIANSPSGTRTNETSGLQSAHLFSSR